WRFRRDRRRCACRVPRAATSFGSGCRHLLAQLARRVTRLLERRGRLEQHPAPTDALEVLKGASVQARLPLPPGEPGWTPPPKRRCATRDGFSLHANVRIHANDRQALEQLCLYAARGAISLERLEAGWEAFLPDAAPRRRMVRRILS